MKLRVGMKKKMKPVIKQRIDYFQVAPDGINIMIEMEKYLATCHQSKKNLDRKLIELVKIHVSQINRCAYCLDMHTKDARAIGEDEQRIYGLSAWKEAPYYSNIERAALAWAEANTLIATNGITSELFENTMQYFTEEQIVDLTLVITQINSWNRIAISFRVQAGTYTPVNS